MAEWPVSRRWRVRIVGDLWRPFERTTLRIDGAAAWRTAPVAGGLALGAALAL
jgi:hypothetical protein